MGSSPLESQRVRYNWVTNTLYARHFYVIDFIITNPYEAVIIQKVSIRKLRKKGIHNLSKVIHFITSGCESWTIKKAKYWRIDAFDPWWWRRLLRVPWTARRSNQSILKEIHPGCSLEGLMLKLKLQYFRHLMRSANSFEKTLMLGKIEDRSRRQWKWVWINSGGWWWTGRPGVLRFVGSPRVRHNWATELNWTELN